MTTTLIPLSQAGNMAPVRMRERIAAGQAANRNFADGIANAFPTLSIKGKVFRARFDGEPQIYRDPQTGHPYAYLDVVLVQGSKLLAKTWYKSGYVEGDQLPPDCWSLDSVRPDPSIPAAKKVNPTCLDCPFNVFGSRITPDGKQAKECSDSRRVAVILPNHLADPEPLLTSMLMRVPQSSLKNMKNYVELLARNGYEPGGCVSRLSFDATTAFPKLQFEFVGPVTDAEFDVIEEMSNSGHINAMLKAPDFDTSASQIHVENPNRVKPQVRQAAPVTDSAPGFGPGMVKEKPVVRQAQQAVAEPEVEEEQEVQLIELPDGEGFLNPVTGEITKPVQAKAEPEIDPNVIPVQGGRFYNRVLGKFVDSQYKDAAPATAVPAKEEPAKPKRTRVAKPKEEPAQVARPAQDEAVQQPEQQEEEPKQTVKSASPKLESLIAGLKNKQPSGNA